MRVDQQIASVETEIDSLILFTIQNQLEVLKAVPK